ncbi:hypothetical protein [Bacillus sp. COPE52]|uniref:hypothetical protein n=1 Tax=Bacillus sp. COPE52 TaxID=2233998 RepID=UPI000E102443|nr:hypothetical protein [Bacillus sp. COPE52]AXK21481.1 hypothetical protein DPQ31_28840 [Bacillus sp. COPE52]
MGMNGRFGSLPPISAIDQREIARRRIENPNMSVSEVIERMDAERRAEEYRRIFRVPDMSVSEIIELLEAEKAIKAQYHKLGSNSVYGVLGEPSGKMVKESDGVYSQQYQYGKILSKTDIAIPKVEPYYICDIFIGAIKCFGTEDESSDDEPYLIITNINTSSAFLEGYERNIARTWKSPTFRGIEEKEVFGQDLVVFNGVLVGPYGVRLKIALMEHEHGNEEQLRQKVEENANKIARDIKNVASALSGVNVEDASQNLDSEILDALGDLSLDVITDIFKDDIVDEKEWVIDGTMLKQWVDEGLTATSGVNHPDLPSNVETNFPRDNEMTRLFSGGGGSYKVYLRVIPWKISPQA